MIRQATDVTGLKSFELTTTNWPSLCGIERVSLVSANIAPWILPRACQTLTEFTACTIL